MSIAAYCYPSAIFLSIIVKKRIVIVIADDEILFRKWLTLTLESVDDFKVVGEASDGEQAIEIILDKKPDIAFVDYDMPLANGLEVAAKLVESRAKTKLVIMSANNSSKVISKAKTIGVAGYISKECKEDDMIEALKRIAEGETGFITLT